MFNEELTPFGKAVVTLGVFAAIGAAIANVMRGEVNHPYALGITLVGFILFFVAKISVILRVRWISFGPRFMSTGMADLYRIGYWLMIVGIVATFL